jgi:hypothetical protein
MSKCDFKNFFPRVISGPPLIRCKREGEKGRKTAGRGETEEYGREER